MLPIQRLDKQPVGPEAPRYCVPPAIIVTSAEEVVDAEVIVADFGESFICHGDTTRTDVTLRTPVLLLPPESIFEEGLGKSIDAWTAGLTIYEILGERPLFEGFVPDGDHALAEMISTLGPLPDRWWTKWSTKGEFFLDDGTWKQDTTRCHAPYSRPLSERLRIMGRGEGGEEGGEGFSSRELTALEAFLGSLLTYEPSERITAAAAQDEAWVVEYGLPAVKRNRAGGH